MGVSFSEVAFLRDRLRETMKERDALLNQIHGDCLYCKNQKGKTTFPCTACVNSMPEKGTGDYWEWLKPNELKVSPYGFGVPTK